MTKAEYIEELKGIKDPQLREAFAEQYHNDSLADKKVLLAKAQASLGMYEGLKAVQDATTVSPLTYAFNESESGLRNLVDPNSPSNWTNMSSQALLDAAITGGYVKDVPKLAPEWKKQGKRKQFGDFLNMLARESYDQGRRNAVREYENAKWYDPQKLLNSTLFHTYEKRAKEQALKGEGATSFDQLSNQDLGTLGLDIGANTALGAGAAGISKGLLSAGVGNAAKNYGLRSGLNVAGSDFGAGIAGGLANVYNRANNTDEGVRDYEWATEPLLTAATNVLATPAALREGVCGGAHLIGLGGEKLNNLGKKNALKWTQRIADEKYAEPELAALLRDLEESASVDLSNSVVKPETRAKIENMYDILNDGATKTPGKETSLLDELQQLYDASAKGRYGVVGEYMSPASESALPNIGRFSAALDSKIASLEGQLKNSVGKEAAPAVQRELDYYKNFRELMDNGLINPDEYLNYADKPEQLVFKENNIVAGPGDNVPVFELGKKASKSDIELMKDYIKNVNEGRNLLYDDGLMNRIELLKDKYPAFKRYANSIETVPAYTTEEGMYTSVWPSLGRKEASSVQEPLIHFYEKPRASYENYDYGFLPSYEHPVNGWMPKQANVAAIVPNAKQILADIAKPAVIESRLAKFDKPDNSMEALDAKMGKLRQEKPEAVEAAINWKYDPRLEESKQLTAEQRNLVNQWRAKKLEEAMNGR